MSEASESLESAAAIITKRGDVVLLDADDLERVGQSTWFVNVEGYVQGKRCADGKKTTIFMHREIVGLPAGDKRIVDHINGIRHDNRRANLRICTNAENQRNRGKNKNNTSGYKGVSLHKLSGLWKAMIKVDRKDIFLGYFKNPEDAHQAYSAAAAMYHGEFANT